MKKNIYVHCHNCGEQGCVTTEDNILDLSTALDEVRHIQIEIEDLGPAHGDAD
jgi:hypothetical protein